MEQLIRELNDPVNQAAPERINEIQRQIQRLQRDKSAWQGGLDLLQHGEAIIRFYGALTLTIKINADWDNDGIGTDEQMKFYLLESLLSHYIRLVTLPDSNFVLQKLCSTLVTFFAKPDSEWTYPIRHLFARLLGGQYTSEAALPVMRQLCEAATNCSDAQLKGVLMLVRTMAEDLGGHTSSAVAENRIARRLAVNCLDAWQLFEFSLHRVLGHEDRQDATLPIAPDSAELLQMVLQAMPFWTSTIKHECLQLDTDAIRETEVIAKECIRIAVRLLGSDSFLGHVLQLLVHLQQSSARILRDAVPNFPATVAESKRAKEMLYLLVQGDFSAEGILYVDLLESVMSQVDTTTSEYLHSGRYNEVVQTLRRLLRCEGVAVIEDPVCQIALEKVSEIVEGFADWEDGDTAATFIRDLAADACDACLSKVKIPQEQMSIATQDWDADDRAKFQDFRYDVHDFLQSAFAVLGNALIEGIVKTILSQVEDPDWSAFEAAIFSLTAFSDTMSSDPGTYDSLITTVLSSPPWHYILQSGTTVPDKARQTGIRFIADNVVYLRRHPDSMVLVLNFLFSSLHLQGSASAASKAIYSLCESHRTTLTEGLPQFMASLTTVGDLAEAESHRLYAAIAAIIQALPTEEAKIQPLAELLASIPSVSVVLTGEDQDQDERQRLCIDAMQTLASIGRGLRSPDDVPIDLESPNTQQSMFWHNGPGASGQRDVLNLYQAILLKMQPWADATFIEACCDFIKSGFTEQHPSPFKFPDSVGLNLVTHWLTLENPTIDTAMTCASSFLAAVESNNIQSCLRGILYPVITNQQTTLSSYHQAQQLPSSNFASASLDFLARLTTRWGAVWFFMQDAGEMLGVAFELALVLMAESDTLPRRSAAAFFATVVDCSGPGGPLEMEASQRISVIVRAFGPRTLSLVARLLGGDCARSEIESLTETLKKSVQRQPMLTKTVLREAVKQEAGVLTEKALKATSVEQRNRFVAQVEALRGARKTNDIVKEFWLACRGSGFGYIT
ncbi:member of the karyopherin-beta [Exophiala xenobiotica]|nr:member of the karyopherin-beta [Exophiala xenobiotica]